MTVQAPRHLTRDPVMRALIRRHGPCVLAPSRAYRRRARPTPKALRSYGERWKPYRSMAAWYLWRAASEARQTVK